VIAQIGEEYGRIQLANSLYASKAGGIGRTYLLDAEL
jgi:hypothetical protein